MASPTKLRRLKRKDWKDMFEYGSDEETVKFVTWGPYKTEQEAKDANLFLRKNSDQIFAITVYGKMIGTVSIMNITDNSVEIGYILNKDYWGMGIGTQALTLSMNFAYRWHKGKTLYASVIPENIASQNLLKKCGFEQKEIKENGEILFHFKND
ncbi:GNAT family N-acetyltransferase [Mycoplasma marinum]|uniref:N-acetyltransferase domain-containing protein n=1 Tax=Mycoplasma marinum TaxID=1937190 RepID=A0A4V2NI05_9MOLU|nr:GNAT family N-acetyltransferase [Mycoplasma marinum]TCG10938.1 hypothetical protein C4B24_03445 [Mycoplasma marinum]